MGSRGKRSADESLAIRPSESRPPPLDGLNKAQADEWLAIVNRMPADWFPRETHQLLAQYCRHSVSAQMLSKRIDKMELAKEMDFDAYEKLLKMREREGRAMSSLATRMRISQQATYDKTKSRQSAKEADKPWEA